MSVLISGTLSSGEITTEEPTFALRYARRNENMHYENMHWALVLQQKWIIRKGDEVRAECARHPYGRRVNLTPPQRRAIFRSRAASSSSRCASAAKHSSANGRDSAATNQHIQINGACHVRLRFE
ncbi:hypothetical protein GCM10011534_12050 [Pseudooceanicola nanhaiensis]|uniref:Uncharacterized protein n=1 Tax=Pseudooceanicola nanhaiensis TaxID=375761 RepID=A0A917SQP3_9RHOB|nr:hypothetical protein GCM10011534_12050 [Pseudooceanicola nanhaiensis]